MAFRTLPQMKLQSTTVAQPLAGSWISAGIGGPSNVPLTLTLGTASSATGYNDANAIFAAGDPVFLINPDGSGGENARIQSVSGNTVTLGCQNDSGGGFANPVTRNTHISGAYGTGTFIALAWDVNNIFVQFETVTASHLMYLGAQYNMSSTFKRIAILAATSAVPYASYTATETSAGNPFRTSELWALGSNTGDIYNVSFGIA